jgi:hypothetical protein
VRLLIVSQSNSEFGQSKETKSTMRHTEIRDVLTRKRLAGQVCLSQRQRDPEARAGMLRGVGAEDLHRQS